MPKLGLTLPMHPDELTLGYFCRIAKLNSREPYHFGQDLGMPFSDVIKGTPAALQRLSDLTGADFDQLSANAHSSGKDTNILIRANSIRSHNFVVSRIRFCPRCLKEDVEQAANKNLPEAAYIVQRLQWSVLNLRTCSHHSVFLIDEPPSGNPHRDYDFASKFAERSVDIDQLADQAIEADGGAFETYINDRINNASMPANWLNSIETGVAAMFCERLGLMIVNGVDAQISGQSKPAMMVAANAGFAIASEGPDAIKQTLLEVVPTSKMTEHSKAQHVFGEFYKWLAFAADATEFKPVKTLLRNVILESIPISSNEILLGELVGDQGRRTILSIAKEVSTHPKRLTKIFSVENAIATNFGIPSVHYKSGIALATRAKLALGEKDLIQYLDADRVSVAVIADRYIPKFSATEGVDINRLFAREDADAFMARITKNAVNVAEVPETVETINRTSKLTNRRIYEIIDLLLAGTLSQVFMLNDNKSFRSIYVNPAEIRQQTIGQPLRGQTAEIVGKKYRLPPEVIGRLISQSYLSIINEISPLNRSPLKTVLPEISAAFFAEFATCKILADERASHPKTILKRLLAAGLRPAFPYEEIGTYLFRRQDINSAYK